VSLHAPALAVLPIAAALGDPQALAGTASIDADLRGAGRSPHAIAASLDGHLGIALSDGEMSNALLASALGTVFKAAKLPESALVGGGTTKLRCLAARLDVSHGVVTVNTLVADTTRLLVQGGGTVDLGQETLALHVRPLLRAGPGIVVPVRVGGGFRDPKLGSDFGGKGGLLGSLAAAAAGEHGGDACLPALASVRGPDAIAVAAPAPPLVTAKPPKPIDVLRGLLQH
jgi:AsmA protein